MRTWMLRIMVALMVLGALGLVSCGKNDDDDWASENIAGKVVLATVTEGSPVLAQAGERFSMTFNADAGRTYSIVAITAGTANSQGTYAYEKTGADIGEITLTDTTNGITIEIILTYTAEGRGNYTANVLTPGVGGNQTGTFTEEE